MKYARISNKTTRIQVQNQSWKVLIILKFKYKPVTAFTLCTEDNNLKATICRLFNHETPVTLKQSGKGDQTPYESVDP